MADTRPALGRWGSPVQISERRENMKLVNMPKPLVLKLIDGFSIKVWIKLVFIFDIPLILLQPPYAGHKPVCWGASLQGSQHHTCMVQHMGVSMDAAAGHVRASWIMTFYSSYFWVVFFRNTLPSAALLGLYCTVSLWKMQFMKHLRNKLCSCIFH